MTVHGQRHERALLQHPQSVPEADPLAGGRAAGDGNGRLCRRSRPTEQRTPAHCRRERPDDDPTAQLTRRHAYVLAVLGLLVLAFLVGTRYPHTVEMSVLCDTTTEDSPLSDRRRSLSHRERRRGVAGRRPRLARRPTRLPQGHRSQRRPRDPRRRRRRRRRDRVASGRVGRLPATAWPGSSSAGPRTQRHVRTFERGPLQRREWAEVSQCPGRHDLSEPDHAFSGVRAAAMSRMEAGWSRARGTHWGNGRVMTRYGF